MFEHLVFTDHCIIVVFFPEAQLPEHLRLMALLSQEGFEFVPYREV